MTLLVRGPSTEADIVSILGLDMGAFQAHKLVGTYQTLVLVSGPRQDPLLRLTSAGRSEAQRLCDVQPQCRSQIAHMYVELFIPLNARVKAICASWQLHGGISRPSRTLRALRQASSEAQVLLLAMAEQYRRCEIYARRLRSSVELALSGHHEFVASPRVDSFHSAWFELHQELLFVLGRDRTLEDEVD